VNIGLSLLHAFGYGLPVVTSDHVKAHNPEIEAFDDGFNGLYYRDGDVESLSQSLERVLIDKPLANKLSDNAKRTVSEKYNLFRMVDGMEAAIRYCANQSSVSAKELSVPDSLN
jgi:glycosyltransferase involved in cell wall biosynthesis